MFSLVNSFNSLKSTFNKLTSDIYVKNVGTVAGALVIASSTLLQPVHAFGPQEIILSDLKYKQVELCNGQKPIMPGQKAMEGLYAACIEVEANAANPSDKPLKDVSVYGFVKDNDAGNSVLPNNPDFSTDAGQYAMIKSVPGGKSSISFQFVAAVTANTAKGEPLPGLTFFKTKAVSYPGGSKFKALDICEIDPRADGCVLADED